MSQEGEPEPLFNPDETTSTDYEAQILATESQDRSGIRLKWSEDIGWILKANTLVTLVIVFLALVIDYCLAIKGKTIPSDMRIISTNVIIAMIGATLVQVGGFAIIIANWGFKQQPRK